MVAEMALFVEHAAVKTSQLCCPTFNGLARVDADGEFVDDARQVGGLVDDGGVSLEG